MPYTDSPYFFVTLLVEHRPALTKRKQVEQGFGAENGNVRSWQARTCQSSLSEYSKFTSFIVTTLFYIFSYHLSSVFWPIYNRSRVCEDTFRGLSKPIQGFFQAVEDRLCTFTIKDCLLMVVWAAHWSNTTEIFFCIVVFVAQSERGLVAISFCNMRTHCFVVKHMVHGRKTR